MKQPSLVVHSHDVPGYKYRMKWTWEMLPGASAGDIVNWVLHANDGQFGARRRRLENIVVNCHGSPGSLFVGGTSSPDLNIGNMGVFSGLRSCDIGTIWLVACEVAAQQGVARPAGGGHWRGRQDVLRRASQDGGLRGDRLGRDPARQRRLLPARLPVGLHRRLRGSHVPVQQTRRRARVLRLVIRYEDRPARRIDDASHRAFQHAAARPTASPGWPVPVPVPA